MANRSWRSNAGYQSFNQILTPMSYYQQPVTSYQSERKSYGGRGGYREDNYQRERKDFQSKPRDRISPIKRRSPYQRSHETSHGNARKDYKKSHGHYEVKVPRLTFDIKELSTSSLKFRYPKMYTPSDFFHSRLNVQEAFPIYRPMKLGNHCDFQVLNKDVELDDPQTTMGEPEDANYKFSAKVMLMTTPALPDLCKLTCHMPIDGTNKFGLYKNVQFLVGSKGKNEPMAIGGPWSPSLDGLNPEEDLNVLIRTAIRTCKTLTGIDLSHCKKWYKFLDIHYYRPTSRKEDDSEKKEDNEEEPTVEVVTIFIPDVWSCIPSDDEWTAIRSKYEKKLQSLINPIEVENTIVDEVKVDVEKTEPVEKLEENKNVDDSVKLEGAEKIENAEESQAELDLNQMKVTELRSELTARGLEPKGLKNQLIQRLQEAIESEKKAAEVKVEVVSEEVKAESDVEQIQETQIEDMDTKEVEPPKIYVSKQLPEKEQRRLEKMYKINDKPSILVHANKNAKGGRFECALMTLESLLEYRIDDQKEHTFEVSLFAEQFSEMIQRDAAFVIYKALCELPEVVKESDEPDVKKARVDTEQGARKSKIVADMQLLSAFCIFDCDNGGYLRDHDLECVLHCVGLNLSRSQVKKLMSRMPCKKGSVMYRDVVERDVVEGSVDDVTVLRVAGPAVGRLIELAQGNRAFFEEADTHSLATRTGALLLLDKLNVAEGNKMDHELQLTLLNDELNRVNTAQGCAGDVETHLRDNIKKLQDKLVVEKECFEKLTDVSNVYSGLLKGAREHMDISVKSINDRFDYERQIAEAKAKEEADRAKEAADKIKAEADRAREEADKIKAEADRAREEADKIKAEADRAKEADKAKEEAVKEMVVGEDVPMENLVALV